MKHFIEIETAGGTRLLNPGLISRGEIDSASGNVVLHTMDGAQVSLSKVQWQSFQVQIGDADPDPDPQPAEAPPAAVESNPTV